jgi:predicted nucleotidyltransferase component of viral defense system
MTKKKVATSSAASVRTKLLKVARERGDDFQLVLLRYANERLLFRLSTSSHAKSFVLKGAALFTLWTGAPHRATRDLDLLGFGDPAIERMQNLFTDVLRVDGAADDGLVFDLASLRVDLIREDQEYGGVRVTVDVYLTTAKIPLQVDVGFGDAITPDAVEVTYPTLLDMPAPRLRAYPRETVVAEKLEAMAKLGIENSRMKDFYDVAALAAGFAFDGAMLVRAIAATFNRRQTPIPGSLPLALTSTFADDALKQQQWAAFVRRAGVDDTGSLSMTIASLVVFLDQPLAAVRAADGAWTAAWPPGGPWSP